MRAGEIKAVLAQRGADTRGLFDKAELSQLLVRLELESLAATSSALDKVTTLPIIEVPVGDSSQTYVGIDLIIKNEKLRFMIDTGATMNLIRQETVSRLGLVSQQQVAYTVGLGGGGTVAAKKAIIPDVQVGRVSVTVDVAILDNAQALPNTAQGLLGLSFLQSLGEVVEFDFTNKQFRFGPREAFLSAQQKQSLHEVSTRRIYTGLIASDIYVNDSPFPFTAMIDMGSAHTIANPLAVEAITSDRLERLPDSKNMCAGIDGRPVTMKTLSVNKIQIGGSSAASRGPMGIYAANIPGMSDVGLGNIPAFILGMDVLGRRRLLIDITGNKIYVEKS